MAPYKKTLKTAPGFFRFLISTALKRALFVPEAPDPSFFFKCLLYAVLLLWGFSFFGETDFERDRYGAMDSFWHNIHLVFHEAGHILFHPFGEFMGYFGGTLAQCLIPLTVMAHFIWQKDNFSASFGLWWLGQSFLDVAPYIYDAWDQKLMLLGGGTGRDQPGAHDWRYLLSAMDSLENYKEIAYSVNFLGKLILLLSLFWGGALLYKKILILWRIS